MISIIVEDEEAEKGIIRVIELDENYRKLRVLKPIVDYTIEYRKRRPKRWLPREGVTLPVKDEDKG